MISRMRVLNIITLCLALALCAAPVAAQQRAGEDWTYKVGSRLRLAWRIETGRAGPVLSAKPTGRKVRKVILRFADKTSQVQSPHLKIVARRGDVATGLLDLDHLPEIAADPAIATIKADSYSRPHDDPGVLSVRAARVLPKLGYTGKGVLIGIVDSGIDWQHRDFRNPDGTSRIAAILDLSDLPDSLSGGDLGAESPYGGILVMKDDIDRALHGAGTIRQADYLGHGTLVAGTAAASPAAENDTINIYGGTAPAAEIIAVKTSKTPRDTLFSTYNILTGITFVDSMARALNQPYVLNLSFGGYLGPHDGTSEMDRFVSSFTDPEIAGRAVVVGAGNGRLVHWHASGELTESFGDSTLILGLAVTGDGSDEDELHIEIWLSQGHPGVIIGLMAPSDTIFHHVILNGVDTLLIMPNSGIVHVSNAYGRSKWSTRDRLIEIDLYDAGVEYFDSLTGPDRNIRIAKGPWTIGIYGRTGSFDAYMYATVGLQAFFGTYVSELGTVSEPATAPEVITVGAYNVRTDWLSLEEGVEWASAIVGPTVPGNLSSFSSLGPNRKGVMKPEITAPGRWVMASFSSQAWPEEEPISIFRAPDGMNHLFISKDSIHAVSKGTSFSAPIVAGICALLLETDPYLTHPQIKDILTSSAATDSLTAGAPNNYWGYGRANAIGALTNLLGPVEDSLALSASLNPPDTLRTDTLEYSISADFTRSAQVLRSFELEVHWPADLLTLLPPFDNQDDPRAAQLAYDTTRAGDGILGISGSLPHGLPAQGEIVRLLFGPLSDQEADSVQVQFELKKVTGDPPDDLAGMTGTFQAAPVAIRPGLFCALAGDVDQSGKVEIFDLLELLRILSGRADENACSDINLDGSMDIFDLLELLKLL